MLLTVYSFSQSENTSNSSIIYKKAVYNSKIKTESSNVNIKQTLDLVDKMIEEVEYELIFNETQSIYRQVEKLQLKDSPFYKMAAGPPNIYYRNLKTNELIRNNSTMGLSLNIQLNPKRYDWIITKEKKYIGKYLCYKAKTKYKEYNPINKNEVTFQPEVWFTPEIPVPFGPEGLDGLPGLVLEATKNGQTYFYASKLKINIENIPIEILKPKGKSITEERYTNILVEKYN